MNQQTQPSPIGHIGAQQTQAPATPQYSSEPTMNANASDEQLTQVTVVLDKESLKIIKEASTVHAESIVNLGIKLFAKTNIYKEFMLKSDFKSLEQNTEDIVSLTDISAATSTAATSTSPTAHGAPVSTTISAPAAGGFSSW
ncbi:MAG: hypothetical protein DRG78_09310 [Epsilonproteobacteria bacterium]|nr:MAG: hypothetical protein DRG78_09310 [Campylobacterota bacterium]